MHKILVEVNKNTLSFSLLSSRVKSENLNDTNVIDTERMVFSDKYINDNLELIKSFFNVIVLKKEIDTISISINAIFPLIYRIISDISKINNVILLEDKTVSYIIFEHLVESKYIKNIECYSMPSFMLNKLDIDKDMNVKSRCEVLFLSNFMEKNEFNTYSDVYYKKSIEIDCKMSKEDKSDIESFLKFNNKLKVINLYNVDKDNIELILELLKSNNRKNIKLVLHQNDKERSIIDVSESLKSGYKKLLKDNNIRIKVNYTKEYRDKNTLKQVNLSFFRLILILFIIIAIVSSIVFSLKYEGDTDTINEEMDNLDEVIDLNKIDEFIQESESLIVEDEDEEMLEEDSNVDNNTSVTPDKPSNTKPSPYYRKFEQVFEELLKENNETVGWLKVNNTKINYPVTKHSDNKYYLNHSYYKKKNSHGWIFMDYRNSIDTLDKNTIVYGHRNSKGLMFGTLKNVLEKSWYTNKNNQIITFNTLNEDMKWQIFSIYTLKNTNDYLITNFTNDTTYGNFLNKVKGRSIYDFGVEVGVQDNILTLSTCYNNAEYRLVVHAKLMK